MSKSSKLKWLKLGYSEEEAEELSRLGEFNDPIYIFESIDEVINKFGIADVVIDKLCEPTGYLVTSEDLTRILEKEELI